MCSCQHRKIKVVVSDIRIEENSENEHILISFSLAFLQTVCNFISYCMIQFGMWISLIEIAEGEKHMVKTSIRRLRDIGSDCQRLEDVLNSNQKLSVFVTTSEEYVLLWHFLSKRISFYCFEDSKTCCSCIRISAWVLQQFGPISSTACPHCILDLEKSDSW